MLLRDPLHRTNVPLGLVMLKSLICLQVRKFWPNGWDLVVVGKQRQFKGVFDRGANGIASHTIPFSQKDIFHHYHPSFEKHCPHH